MAICQRVSYGESKNSELQGINEREVRQYIKSMARWQEKQGGLWVLHGLEAMGAMPAIVTNLLHEEPKSV